MRFIVRFLDLVEQTKDEFDYSNLLDAMRIIKNTPLDGVIMSHSQFERDLIVLLTSGFIYAGPRSKDYIDGKYQIQLLNQVENGAPERPIYGPHIVPFVVGAPIPEQRVSPVADDTLRQGDMGMLPVATNNVTEMHTIMKPVSPVAESGMSQEWVKDFMQGEDDDAN